MERKATEDEIKKQFKKRTMQLHPDKNHDDPDATKKFQELNEAYQCLIDPNERAWYDSHRTQILSGKNFGEDAEEESFQFNIWQYFSSNCYKGFDDNEGGFFKVYSEVFDLIIAEEEDARLDNVDKEENLPSYKNAPRFGDSKTPLDKVAQFYEYWENFITSKSFAWADEHKTSKDYERRMNRMIDQDNKKARQKEKKKYMETMKHLVEFVQKRDPRVVAMKEAGKELELKKKAEREQKEIEKKKAKEEEKKRAREEEQRRFEELDRMKEELRGKAQGEANEDEEEDEFYCQVCKKSFRSENQLKNHEKSKQHLKAVKDILSEVALDGEQEVVKGVEKELERIQELKKDAPPAGSKNKKKKKKKANPGNAKEEDDESKDDSKSDDDEEKDQKIDDDKNESPEKKEEEITEDKSEKEESDDESDSKAQAADKNKKKKKDAAKAKRQTEALGLAKPKEELKEPAKVVKETKAARKRAEKKEAYEKEKEQKAAEKEAEKAGNPLAKADDNEGEKPLADEKAGKEPAKASEQEMDDEDDEDAYKKQKKDKKKDKKEDKKEDKKGEKDSKTKDAKQPEKGKAQENNLECKYCGQAFDSKTVLFEHLKKKHKLKF